jgi:predicted membrane protein
MIWHRLLIMWAITVSVLEVISLIPNRNERLVVEIVSCVILGLVYARVPIRRDN